MIAPDEAGRAPKMGTEDVAEVLEAQSAELSALQRELIKSYEKELAFFSNLEKRDRQDQARQKKIWWLESEVRRLEDDLQRTRAALHTLQNSPMGRIQRKYWKMRQGGRR